MTSNELLNIETYTDIKCQVFGTRWAYHSVIDTDEKNAFLHIGNALASLIDDQDVKTIIIRKIEK